MKLRHPATEIKRITTSIIEWFPDRPGYTCGIVAYSGEYRTPYRLVA